MGDEAQLLFVVSDAAARAAERERRTDNDGIPEFFGDRHALVHRIGNIGGNDGLTDLFHRLFEKLTILRAVDRVELGTDELDAPLIEETLFRELAAHGKTRLPAERGKQRIGTLLDDDTL